MKITDRLRRALKGIEYLTARVYPADYTPNEYYNDIEIVMNHLEVLEILKKQIKITEDREDTDFGNYTTTYYLNITTKGLDWKQFDKIRTWLEK